MNTDLNNNFFKDTSKGADIIELKRYIVEKIDENEIIRRYCRWLTKTPLSKNGLDYTGELIQQRELGKNYSITKEVKQEQGLSHKKILIPYAFSDELVTEEQLFIFVYPYSNGFNGTMSNNSFSVDIMCPLRYNEINPYGDERIYKILYEIINVFDGKSVEEEKWVERVGNVRFDVKGYCFPYRLTKTKNMMVYPLKINAKSSNVR